MPASTFFYIEYPEGGRIRQPGGGGPFPSMKSAVNGILELGKSDALLKGDDLTDFLDGSFVYEGKKNDGGPSYSYEEAAHLVSEEEGI
jgi:hypothetical protein